VLAFPSLYEGFGLPLLEAMAHGVPAVVGAAGALPELALEAAIAVQPHDVDAIAGALERLLSDETLRAKLGDEGKRRAASFTWDRAAEQTLEVLHRIGNTAPRKVA
jgi:glycosyltransferase involved in cell wall biosynthesis